MYPQGRLKVIDVHVERGQSNVLLVPKIILRLGKARPELRTIVPRIDGFLFLGVGPFHRNIHLGHDGTTDGEVGIDVGLDGGISEVDLREMSVILFGQVEGKLVIYG